MNTWKLSIKPNSAKGFDPFEFCKNNALVGVGWAKSYTDKQPSSPVEAKEMVVARYGKWDSALKALLERMKPNDHIWLHQGGHYYLCKAGPNVFYGADIHADFIALDLGHCREADWVKVPEIFVSGSIQRGTIARRMIQRIKITPEVFESHQVLFDELKKDPLWEPTFSESHFDSKLDLFKSSELLAIMSPEDLEDIVAAYLQSMGWILIKSTCFGSKSTFEFMMRNRKNETCLLQVKSGKSPSALAPEHYRKHVAVNQFVYLLSTHPKAYPGDSVAGVKTIKPEDLIDWMKANAWAMTDALKLRICLYMGGKP